MLSFDTEPDVAPAPVIARVTAKQVIHSFQGKPKLNPYSEETRLMLAVRDTRDKRAFGKLFDHFGPRLKGVAMRSGLSSGQAEDMVQDVMLTLWRKAHLFDPTRAQVSSWLYQIARNRQIDILRKENRPMPEALKAESEATEESAADTLALDQEVSALKQALAKLKPAQREMVEKAYLGELSHTDIEAETGLPLGTIKSRIRLGLEKLRHELDGIRKS
ncbi:sigma-70 family RNA polymerase sigma factor [uncultured Lentibacter sp.]|uniref:sigma-70 family RNA polymerase sigma factor n=1 Tax=uncultured Lentibacter sp. TaxID=1659309 RepID=UPI00260B5CEB|nr:sigma-70 family RNA polymerase sigma factor [uncultured Lentibacter sp.]